MAKRNKFYKKISPLIQDQMPDFVQAEYSTFVDFVKAYYEWMDQEGYVSERIGSLLEFRDVDETPDSFLQYLENEYMDSFPVSMEANKRLVLKNIRDFYRTRGTPDSFKFLFRILYAIDISIEEPKRKLLKLSGGVWIEETSIRVSNHFGAEWDNMVGNQITQGSASAYVDKVRRLWVGGSEIVELVLYEIVGTFQENEVIYGTYTESSISKTIWGTPFVGVTSLSIISAGSGYEVGDVVNITGACTGVGAKAYVSKVGNSGEIEVITQTSPGINYLTLPVNTVTTNAGTGASIIGALGLLFDHPGFSPNSDSSLSSESVIQDSDYWQEFSYVINHIATDSGDSPKTINTYKSVVKSTIHPAGTKMFGRTTIQNTILDENDGITNQIQRYNVFDTTSSSSSSGEATTLLETITS